MMTLRAVRVVVCGALVAALGAACSSTGGSTRKRSLTTPPAGSWEPSAARAGDATMLYGQTRVVEAPARARPATDSGAVAAPAIGIDSSGQVVTAGDFRGRVVVLDFWATWCAPCKASSPAFQQLADRFAGDQRVMTLAVHTDHTGDPRAYMREHGYTFRMVPRGQEFAAAYRVNVLPTFIVLDQRGREIYRDTGLMGDSQRAEVERLVRAQLR